MTAPETALIGYTGFVGGNLARAHRFDALYNSSNIEDLRGKRFGLVVCAGAPSLKWYANANPEHDRSQVDRLIDCVREARADTFILVSTVAVYPKPQGVDEDSPIDSGRLSAYGRHRFALEEAVRERFADALVVRLPGVFGPGLKKNVIFDLLHGDASHTFAIGSTLQFYDVRRLWDDIARARRHGIGLLNIATEPLPMSEVGAICSRGTAGAPWSGPVVHDDMQTRHAGAWGRTGRYLYVRGEVAAELAAFARQSAGTAAR